MDHTLLCHAAAAALSRLCRIHGSVFACGEGFSDQAGPSPFCTACRYPICRAAAVCEYGLKEACRWQGRYIYYCPAGLTFVAACVTDAGGALQGGVTMGPLLLGDCLDALCTLELPDVSFQAIDLPDFSTEQISALADVLARYLSSAMFADNNIPLQYEDYGGPLHSAQRSDISYKVMEYLSRNLDRKLSLDEIASEVYLSRAYVSTLFKQQTGEGIFECLSRLRLEQSKRLLAETDLPLSQVALSCGYEDQSYFTRVFKKSTGLSPRRYRLTHLSGRQRRGL